MTMLSTVIGTRTALTVTGLNSLVAANFVESNALDLHAIAGTSPNRAPADVIIEVELTPGTVSGNKQAVIFAKVSMDGTNYSTGPASGTSTTDMPNLEPLGVLPLASNSTLQRRSFSLMRDLGFIPYALKIVILNDSGANLAGSGNAVNYTIETGDAT